MTCPYHVKKMEERTSANGWHYLRCPGIPCMLFCGKDQGPKYMSAVRKEIHPDICDRWDKMNCLCGHYPVLKQSWSDKNPGRLYLSCYQNHLKYSISGKIKPDDCICFNIRRCRRCKKLNRSKHDIREHRCGYATCPTCSAYVKLEPRKLPKPTRTQT